MEKALGFPGWHHRGFLPHCDFPGLIQLVTFRLWDSMPVSRNREWLHLLAIEDDRKRRLKVEEYLDRGLGQCHLRDPKIARLTERTLLHFHRVRYELLAWCVMPNHVHVLVHVWQVPLWKIVRSWKQFIATNAYRSERRPPARHNAHFEPLRRQREYWDTFMRDEKQERSAIRYIENNPVKAGMCKNPDEWDFGSARCRDKYARLMLPTRAIRNETPDEMGRVQ